MLNSPIRWVGGKSRLRKFILPLIPEHACYLEPFGGAGWVLFGKQPSSVEVYNDIDQELVNFFRVLKHRPEELIASFEWELVSRASLSDWPRKTPQHYRMSYALTDSTISLWLDGVASWTIPASRPAFPTVDTAID